MFNILHKSLVGSCKQPFLPIKTGTKETGVKESKLLYILDKSL